MSSLCLYVSHLYLADVTGLPVATGVFDNSPALGCGVLAAVACGMHQSIPDAVAAMVHQETYIEPSMEHKTKYDSVYKVSFYLLFDFSKFSINVIRFGTAISHAISICCLDQPCVGKRLQP